MENCVEQNSVPALFYYDVVFYSLVYYKNNKNYVY